jgi:hypothetical protein
VKSAYIELFEYLLFCSFCVTDSDFVVVVVVVVVFRALQTSIDVFGVM